METKELAVIVEKSGMERTKAQTVLDAFTEFFTQAAEWEEKTRGLVITNVSQKAEMALARSGRLQLREIRCAAEATRKKLKENILVEGRFIDAIYNLIEGVTKPIENDLLEKEKFVERQEEARIQKITEDRISQLEKYCPDCGTVYAVGTLTDEAFARLLEDSRVAFEAREEKARKEAEEMAARAAEEEIERARIAEENIRLKAEAAKAEAEAKAKEAEIRAERDKQEALIRQAQEETERVRKELSAKAEAEAKAAKEKAQEESRIARAKADADAKAAMAGDREKVLAYVVALEAIAIPAVKSPEAKRLIECIIKQVAAIKSEASIKL
jgi:hypothetical protein